jgi:hypothetical protein
MDEVLLISAILFRKALPPVEGARQGLGIELYVEARVKQAYAYRWTEPREQKWADTMR